MRPKTVARHVWLLWKEQPLLVLGLLVILVLGGREVAGAVGTGGLTAEEKRLTATTRAASTAQTAATATALVVQPVLDTQGVGDMETAPTPYPPGAWTIGWAYDCRGKAGHRPFSLDLYDASDVSFLHGVAVARGIGRTGSGWTLEHKPIGSESEFVLLETGPCAWHVRVMRGHRRVIASRPAANQPQSSRH
jgi:hypothetical protein